MTSFVNNENENINLEPKNENKENFHGNLDEFINNQLNIAKDHKLKQKQEQINKGLGVLDQNNNCIKKLPSVNISNPESINEQFQNITQNYNPLNPLKFKSKFNHEFLIKNIFQNTNLMNNNEEGNNSKLNNNKMDLSDLEIISSSKENENDNILIFSDPNFLENDLLSESEHKKLEESIQKMENIITPLNIKIDKMFNKRESNNLLLKCGESSYKYNKYLE